MSYGIASASLYTICRDEDQVAEILKRFDLEMPAEGEFEVWKPRFLELSFDTAGCEASRSFNENILKLKDWLKDNYSLELKGHWFLECDDGRFRGEIHNGEIEEASYDWLENCSVKDIRQIRKWAERKYLNAPANTSCDEVSMAVTAVCLSMDQCEAVLTTFRKDNPGEIFTANYAEYSSNTIAFGLNAAEVPYTFGKNIRELDRWIRAKFGLKLGGVWFHDSELQHSRGEINDGKVELAELDWLENCTCREINKIIDWYNQQPDLNAE